MWVWRWAVAGGLFLLQFARGQIAFYSGNDKEKRVIDTAWNRLYAHLLNVVNFRFIVGLIDTVIAKYGKCFTRDTHTHTLSHLVISYSSAHSVDGGA